MAAGGAAVFAVAEDFKDYGKVVQVEKGHTDAGQSKFLDLKNEKPAAKSSGREIYIWKLLVKFFKEPTSLRIRSIPQAWV